MPMPMVKAYDDETEQVLTIPATELAPGQVLASVPGVEGKVFLDARRCAYLGPHQQPARIEQWQLVLDRIFADIEAGWPGTPEGWRAEFLLSPCPEGKIAEWAVLAVYYTRFAAGATTPAQRQDVLMLLVTFWINGPDAALATARRTELSRKDAAAIVETLRAERGDVDRLTGFFYRLLQFPDPPC